MKNPVKALISVGSSASLNAQHQSVVKLGQELLSDFHSLGILYWKKFLVLMVSKSVG